MYMYLLTRVNAEFIEMKQACKLCKSKNLCTIVGDYDCKLEHILSGLIFFN